MATEQTGGAGIGDLINIRVDNLQGAATEPQIRALFLPYGLVESFWRPRNEMTHRGGRTAYVEMAPSEAAAAIKGLHGMRLGGESLSVTLARPLASWATGTTRRPVSSVPRRTVTPQGPRPVRGTSDA
ncbi:MAG: RNA-binding protein [Chloroflexi bacterium]|nr:RNA-binding protein [Chloroflexota bacterium]